MPDYPTLTRDAVTAAIRAAVAERGADYVYPLEEDGWSLGGVCVYAAEGPDGLEPACIVGDTLARLGIPLQDMHDMELEAQSKTAFGGSGVAVLVQRLGINIDRAALGGLYDAQGVQDSGGSWGEALHNYLQTVSA